MKLFSEQERTDASPKSWAEPAFVWMDRSAREEAAEIRRELESWFLDFPASDKADLRGRLRSPLDEQHEGALFELTLHALLLRLGCVLEPHPKLEGTSRQPDFLVTDAQGEGFYLEATVSMDLSGQQAAAEKRLNDLRDSLESLESSHFLFDVRTQGMPAQPISGRTIRRRIETDLEDIDWDHVRRTLEEGSWESLPQWDFTFGNFSLTIIAIPRHPDHVGAASERAIGALSGGVRQLNTDQNMRVALERKAGAYGELDKPYVIALNVLGDFPPEMYSVWNALFGRLAVEERLFENGTVETADVRQPDGLWRGPEGVQNTRVSAVLLCLPIRPWNLEKSEPRIVHNPWAVQPCGCGLDELTQWTVGESQMEETEGVSAATIFELPEDWPYSPRD